MSLFFYSVDVSTEKTLENCYGGGELKDTLVYPGKPKTDSNNSYLSGCYRHNLKGCSAIITRLRNSRPI